MRVVLNPRVKGHREAGPQAALHAGKEARAWKQPQPDHACPWAGPLQLEVKEQSCLQAKSHLHVPTLSVQSPLSTQAPLSKHSPSCGQWVLPPPEGLVCASCVHDIFDKEARPIVSLLSSHPLTPWAVPPPTPFLSLYHFSVCSYKAGFKQKVNYSNPRLEGCGNTAPFDIWDPCGLSPE